MSNRKGYYIADQFANYFVTFTVVAWVDVFTRKECKDIIIDSLRYCQENKGLKINAYVFMSNHLHLIIRAEQKSKGLSSIIHDFKLHTAKTLLQYLLIDSKESRREWMKTIFTSHAKHSKRNSKNQFWQHNNRPMICLHPKFTNQKINYIHNNPVKAGIVLKPEEYLYSSARDYMGSNRGLLEIEIIDFGMDVGYIALG